MKILTIIFFVTFSCSVFAQKSIFVRVYNLAGKKTYTGKVFAVTDSSLLLKGDPAPINIPVNGIGFIKTKRPAGNNVLIGSLLVTPITAIVGAASAEPDALIFAYSAAEGAAMGTLVGLPIGAAIGALSIPFKNSKFYLINGDSIKWKEFQLVVANKRGKK